MKQSKLWLSLGAAACFSACLAGIALPLWIGGGSALALAAFWDWQAALCLLVLVAAGGAAWMMLSRNHPQISAAASCGCKRAAEQKTHSSASTTNSDRSIACSLSGADMALRQEEITRFLNESLIDYRRDGQTLELRFPEDVEEQVQRMIRLEQECCSFLLFDIRKQGNEVLATIIVPDAIRDATEEIFEEFLPLKLSSKAKASYDKLGA